MSPFDKLFEQGYAVPLYGLYEHAWRYYDKEVILPHGSVKVEHENGMMCAKWDDVLKASETTPHP